MIEYLEKLVAGKEWDRALALAEQLLLNPDNTPWDLMVIYTMVTEARYETGEFYGAQVAGQLAVKMSRELEAWDYYGHATLCLGVAYARLRQPEQAISTWYEYLAYVPHYTWALRHHVQVLFNIGVVAAQNDRREEALRTLQRAAEVANASNAERWAHTIRHVLIDTYLRYQQLDQIPPLLAKCAHYLRHNPAVYDYTYSFLWHLIYRIRYALATHRPFRALKVARRGLQMAKDYPQLQFQFQFHMLQARAYEQLNDTRTAMEEAVKARVAAMEARRFDLEYEVANYMYGLLSSNPDLMDYLQDRSLWDPSAID